MNKYLYNEKIFLSLLKIIIIKYNKNIVNKDYN